MDAQAGLAPTIARAGSVRFAENAGSTLTIARAGSMRLAENAGSTLTAARAGSMRLAGNAGFALIEVLISTVMLALIVIATFTGFDEANQSTADERARSQADVVAQQDEDRLRSFQINQLSGLNETRTLTYNGTVYTIQSTGEFVSDTTGGTSCSTEAAEASYVRTTSKVTWPGAGVRDPVAETGLITPPAGGQILVQVFNAKGAPITGVTTTVSGPSNATALTGPQGCVVIAGLNEGSAYTVAVHKIGYVTKEGIAEPSQGATVIAGTTEKKPFELDQAGALAVSFETSGSAEAKYDSFLAQNSLLPAPSFKTFGTVGTYETTVSSGMELFPFGEPKTAEHEATGQYQVYAGTCEADSPAAFGGETVKANVLPAETVPVKVLVPPISLKVMSGAGTGNEGSAVTTGFSGTFKDMGTNCNGVEHPFSVSKTANTNELHKAMSFGTFSLCLISNEQVNSKYRKVSNVTIVNEHATGTSLTVYLTGSGTHEERSSSKYTCP